MKHPGGVHQPARHLVAPRVGAWIEEEEGASLPERFALYPGFPNPFNSRITLRFELPREGRAELTIYDSLGRPLRRLADASLPAGIYTYAWDGRGEEGRQVASGVYFCRLQAGDFRAVQRLALVR